jgi:hypothetical protein
MDACPELDLRIEAEFDPGVDEGASHYAYAVGCSFDMIRLDILQSYWSSAAIGLSAGQ